MIGTDPMLRVKELAIFGKAPAFAEKLHVGRPNLGNRDRLLQRFSDMLDRNWLTNDGPLVREFEARIADIAGGRHCVAMANATIALEIASRALDMTGEVIVPAFTFVATAHAQTADWHRNAYLREPNVSMRFPLTLRPEPSSGSATSPFGATR